MLGEVSQKTEGSRSYAEEERSKKRERDWTVLKASGPEMVYIENVGLAHRGR